MHRTYDSIPQLPLMPTNIPRLSTFLLCLFSSVILLSCARSANPDIERGSNYKFRQGYPEARADAVGYIDENGDPGISVAVDLVYGSLVYKENDEGALTASYAIDVQVIEQGGLKRVINSVRHTNEVSSNSESIVYNQDVLNYEDRIEAKPGTYDVNITVTDLNSSRQITRIAQTSIPNPRSKQMDLTNIRMFSKDMDVQNPAWKPMTTYDVAGDIDSLKFIFQVVNSPSDRPLQIDTRLVRYQSDTEPARDMYQSNYGSSTLGHKGIEYDEFDVVQSSQRTFEQAGSVLIELKFAQQRRGNYRFEASTYRNENEEESIFKGRDFGVKSQNYPAVQNARELARPLTYLMNADEYESLMSIEEDDSLKEAIDRFWLRNIGNTQEARSVIRMYYERVEEANKQYSNYKEGWKTDQGMIYVLFGPPWYTEENLDRQVWSYSYNRNDPDLNFLFIQRKLKTEFYPFDNYILQRNNYYYDTQYQQEQLWLSGRILNRNI
ncbi:MAG: GWxTD domain-containing protein [Balneolaceae bacterium]|nr:GWxTD domain-containing protein [Balneolaceae bacterium]